MVVVSGEVEGAGVFEGEDLGGEDGGLRTDYQFVGAPATRGMDDREVGVGA